MELQQLRYFLSASETLSFAETAEEFHVSRQAISSSMKSLESELKTTLFERMHNKATLTPQAREFAVRVRETIALFDQIEAHFCSPSIPVLSLALDAFLFEPHTTILDSLGEYAESEGGSTVQLSQESCMRTFHRVIHRQCDIGIVRTMDFNESDCAKVVLRKAKLGCLVGLDSELAQKEYVTFEDIKGHNWIVPSGYDKRYSAISKLRADDPTNKTTIHTIDEKVMATTAVSRNLGIGVTDFSGRLERIEQGIVVRIPFMEPEYDVYDILFYRKDNPRIHQIQHFAEWMLENNAWASWGLSHSAGEQVQY